MKLVRTEEGDGGGVCMGPLCRQPAAWLVMGQNRVLGRLCEGCFTAGGQSLAGYLLLKEAQKCVEALRADPEMVPQERRALLDRAHLLARAAAEGATDRPGEGEG